MKWFRSNVGLGSRLALLALAIQFVLSFGHFHGSIPQAAPAHAKQSGPYAVQFRTSHPDTFDRSAHTAADILRSTASSDQEPAGQPTDDCAICAVMALAVAMAAATAPDLLAPSPAAFRHLATDVEFVDLNSARATFSPVRRPSPDIEVGSGLFAPDPPLNDGSRHPARGYRRPDASVTI
jgi:hypothetical protein